MRVATVGAAVLVALAGCGSLAGQRAGSPDAVPAMSAPPALALPSANPVSRSPQTRLRDAIFIGVMSGELVVETPDRLLVLDASSGIVSEEIPFPSLPQINGTLLTADSLWVLDHDNGKVARVDRHSGELVAQIDIGGRAVTLIETPEGIWAGSAHVVPESVSLIDVGTNEVVRRIELGAFPIYADGHLWFGRDETAWDSTVRKVDPRTGQIVASIDLNGAEGCYLGGRFPETVWSWCFEPPPNDTEATRLDVDAMTVSGTQPLGAAGGLIGVHEKHSWFATEPADGGLHLLKVNNATNTLEQVYSLDTTVYPTIHDGALWLVDTEAGMLRQVPLSDL